MNTSRISETASNAAGAKSALASTIIEYTFYVLFFLVPLIWLPVTNELFEFNKMILVYFGAAIVSTVWLYKSASEGKFVYKRTPLDVPIFLFLFANIAATVFSIDQHTSIFGYYSRFNGGLLSTISYIILYYALATFFDKKKLFNLLKILLISSTFVAIYGILQHPTPFFRNADGSFRGIDAGYWQQNAQARVFSTLGHPNWLAAFLAMVMPFGFFFLIFSKNFWERTALAFFLVISFLAFTFTYSRGGTIGFAAALLVFILGAGFFFRSELKRFFSFGRYNFNFFHPPRLGFFLSLILISWVATFVIFGNAFTSRGINFASITAEGDTQLAAAGPETGRIRLVVWKGALGIFKHFPLVGSGVETFAFSYYMFRPIEHNLTSEWDFLYNKAHNEFVNYLATTGAVGLATYLILVITFTLLVLRYLNQKSANGNKMFALLLLAGYVGYHAQNFFGFSVVAIALLFYLLPVFFFVLEASVFLSERTISLIFLKRGLYSNIAKAAAAISGVFLIVAISMLWLTDLYYNRGVSTLGSKASYSYLKTAAALRPDEPLYKAYLGLSAMNLALNEKGERRQAKIAESFEYLNSATSISPSNLNIWRIRLQAIYDLAGDEEEYKPQLIETAEITGELAPTQADIQYDLASTYVFAGDYKAAQRGLEKVVGLKFNYRQAWELLLKVDQQLGDEKSLEKHLAKYKEYFPEEGE